jgi:hypothetical protein
VGIAVEYHESRGIEVAHRPDHKRHFVARRPVQGIERFRLELLHPAHQGLDAAVGVEDHRIAVVMSSADHAAVRAEDGVGNIDDGVREHQPRILFVREVKEPDGVAALGRADRVSLIRIVGADGNGLEVILAAVYLELGQPPPTRVALESRPIGNRGSGIAPADPHGPLLVRNPVTDGFPRMLAHGQLSGHDIQFEHRGQTMRPYVAVDDGTRGHLAVAQSLVGFDEHGIRRTGIPVDDLVLKLPLRRAVILHQHVRVLAVGIDGRQP